MGNNYQRVSSDDLKEFRRLDRSLIRKISDRLKKYGFEKEPTDNEDEYYGQDLFRRDISLKPTEKQRFKILCNPDGSLADLSFYHFLGKDTSEFEKMTALLEKYGLTIYQFLHVQESS